jgi:hypothetical protein
MQACSASCLLHAGFLLNYFSPEDGGDLLPRNVISQKIVLKVTLYALVDRHRRFGGT